MEHQSKDILRQGYFEFEEAPPSMRLPAEVPGANPGLKQKREGQVFEAWREELNCEDRLLEEVASMANLEVAVQRVVANKGASGIDGMNVIELKRWARTGLCAMREQLLSGEYRPKVVKMVEIPKPTGGKRMLGIPTVKDRVVQQAMVQVLTPILDEQMSESSYGFRPKRGAHGAIKAASGYVQEGYVIVADLDIAKFFDQVNHDILMERLLRKIRDKRILYYIRQMLRVGMMDREGVCQKREQGTPQGGPLSPLLANVLLDELDKELEKRGLRFCRYADDCIIFVRTKRAGERVMGSITRYIEGELRLRINREKSKVDKVSNCVYLGYVIGEGGEIQVAEKSVKKLKTKVREITRRGRALELQEMIEELNQVTRGWVNYYKLADIERRCGSIDGWIRRRIRCYRLKQCRHTADVKRLMESISKAWARVGEWTSMGRRWWRMSCTKQVHAAMTNAWIRAQGYKAMTDYLRPC